MRCNASLSWWSNVWLSSPHLLLTVSAKISFKCPLKHNVPWTAQCITLRHQLTLISSSHLFYLCLLCLLPASAGGSVAAPQPNSKHQISWFSPLCAFETRVNRVEATEIESFNKFGQDLLLSQPGSSCLYICLYTNATRQATRDQIDWLLYLLFKLQIYF